MEPGRKGREFSRPFIFIGEDFGVSFMDFVSGKADLEVVVDTLISIDVWKLEVVKKRNAQARGAADQ